ncbi:Bgt-50069 [Blumeria graminis f. sp. tritici]|uniref:Bgt-50069 n=1 Tax=Blumeria graminis f. sp. tritici TaxID=62690 RepID=A0A9X9ML22_BLUGR|nr:Bgt-50069 [Blumeria graminis f. sp. tritici]
MAKGLVNLAGPYLEEMEDICPGTGAEFLALSFDGLSQAFHWENIYKSSITSAGANDNKINQNRNTLAANATTGNLSGTNVDLRRPPRRFSPLQHQSREDKRVMTRLDSQCEAFTVEPLYSDRNFNSSFGTHR